jgi:hypothetical protein
MKRGKKQANTLKPVLFAGFIALAILVLWYMIGQEGSLVGQANVGHLQEQVGPKCSCAVLSQHTRYFSSSLQPNGKRLEFSDNDAHSREFNRIKSELAPRTELLELDLSNHLKGLFIIGEESLDGSRTFRGVCSQGARYKPKGGACTTNSECQQLCPNVPGVSDLITQIEIDCATYLTRGLIGIIDNKLSEGEVSLFVQRDLDDVSIKGTCELGVG